MKKVIFSTTANKQTKNACKTRCNCTNWSKIRENPDPHFQNWYKQILKLKTNTISGVVKKDRKKGLGDKLVKHALNYAREQDCSHAHTLASGVFSQKIMKNNGFEVILEKNYEDFKDKHGNVLVEHDIHKTAQINVLKL